MGERIIRNAAKCKHCGDVIESKHVHDLQRCSCGRIFVDGGHDYLRWGFMSEDDFIDLSEVEKVEENCDVQEYEEAEAEAEAGMSEKLKPCPFCGGEAAEATNELGCYVITCSVCNCTSQMFLAASTEMGIAAAREAWNRRARDE